MREAGLSFTQSQRLGIGNHKAALGWLKRETPEQISGLNSWYMVKGEALMVTMFSPLRAQPAIGIRPKALSSHQSPGFAVTGVSLQVMR